VTQHAYNSQFPGDNLHNTLNVFSSNVTPWIWLWFHPVHLGASKLFIVQFVGNKFVCTTVEGLVEIREVFNLKTKLKSHIL